MTKVKEQESRQHRMEWGRLISKISPYTVLKGLRYLKHYGPKEFWIRLHERFEPEEVPYGPWYANYIPDEAILNRQKKTHFAYYPKISLAVPAFRTPIPFLKQLVASVQAQTYPCWELCIANGSPKEEELVAYLNQISAEDSRIHVRHLMNNEGIAGNTNAALELATGEFIGLLDHDDLLAPNALYEVARALNHDRRTDVLYTDEDKVTADLSEHFQPHLKPDFSLDLLRSNNYICHFFVVKKSIVEKVGGFRPAYDGAQDYDFIFRCVEQAERIVHIPEILYHWRTHKSSTADNPASKMYAFEAGRRAIEAHLKRAGVAGEVIHTKDLGFYRVKYELQNRPLVSIIIPNKDETETLRNCLESIRAKSSYKNYELLIVENNSTSGEIFHYYKELSRQPGVRLLRYKHPFNYAAINNYAARKARGEYLLFLNNDIEVITPDWIEEMLSICQRPEVGAVGVKLLYPDRTIQHAGVVVGMGGIAGHMFVNMPADRTGYLHKASILQDMSAVTAACMMVRKSAFISVGGFTEELAVAFNDVDFCLKLREQDYLIVYDPYAELYHLESKTRGAEDDPVKIRRFQSEIEYMRSHWIQILKNGDPYYNKNLSLTKWNYSLRPNEPRKVRGHKE